jgi:hypothetical protein
LKIRPFFPALGLLLLLPSAQAQVYRNLSNARFNTVASGPMQALIVDVPDASDANAVRQAVAAQVNAARQARDRVLSKEIEYMRRVYKRELTPAIPDIVIIRQAGRLALPPIGRTRADNELTFNVPLSTAVNDGGWTTTQQSDLVGIINLVYPTLKSVYGSPSWSGTVKVTNGDNLPTSISDRYAFSGGIYNVSTGEIIFRKFQSTQSTILALTQMMAIAFHGPASISYDAWERGMARAATLVTVDGLVRGGQLSGVDVSDPLWSALDRYDLLNQPPLGNDRFLPVSQANTPFPDSSIGFILFPRLEMSGSAWLKVATEDPSFFKTFNALYYAAFASDNGIKNRIPDLKNLAKQALATDGISTVENMDFMDWYQRQFILDTSVSPGTKLYAWEAPLRPDPTAAPPSDDAFGYGFTLIYYLTAFDAQGNSNEIPLSGTAYPVYWDYNFQNRLSLGLSYDQVLIGRPAPGEGSVAPIFFNALGGDTTLEGRMRVAVDFPINIENVRLYTAPRSMGKQKQPTQDDPNPPLTFNNFWGAVVGVDTGKIHIEADGIVGTTLDVQQGAFGGRIDPTLFSRPRKATVILTDTNGVELARRRVNTGYNEYSAVLYVSDPVQSATATLPSGPAMISFPILPLKPKAADALLNPTNDQPLFNDGSLLLAQWKQSIPGYMLYPTMDPIQPGRGYWSNLAQATPVKIYGRLAAADQDFSTGLIFGWNQIGNPYTTAVTAGDLQFEYHTDIRDTGDLAGAIQKGWIGQNVPSIGIVAIWTYVPASGYVPVQSADLLAPWQGYWIRVVVSEGLTLAFPNPSGRSRAVRIAPKTRAVAAAPQGWAIPLVVRGPDGLGATAYLGQSSQAKTEYDPQMDALRPPDFSRAVPSIAFKHPDWGANAGDYFSDIHKTGTSDPWEITVYAPQPDKTYTLTWPNLKAMPRTTRLVLVDMATGQRQYLQGSSGYSFTPGSAATRKFQVIAEDRVRGSLRIMNVVARPTRAAGGSVQIGFDLSAGATVTTDIRGADGRTIRRLSAGRAASAGTNTLLWDMKNDQAISVPAGSYIVQITAHTPEGDTARAIAPVLVLR